MSFKSIKKMMLLSPWLLTVMFLLPAMTDLLRKTIPGQPNIVTPAISTLFILVAYIHSNKKTTLEPPKIMFHPIKLLVFFWAIYWIISIAYSYKVGIAVLFLRFTPFLIPIIAFKQIKSINDLEGVGLWILLLIFGLFPISIYSIINGNDSLPMLLRPIEIIEQLGRDKRGGFDICSGVFSNGAIMAFSVIACFYILLGLALLRNSREKLYQLGAALSIIVMYSTVRRSTLYFSAIGILAYIYLLKKKGATYIILLTSIIIVMFLVSPKIDNGSNAFNMQKKGIASRINIFTEGLGKIDKRTNNIFLGLLGFWIEEKPFGTFLGYAGRESQLAKVPRSSDLGAIETGSAQIVAETGFLGLIVYILVFIWIWKDILKFSRKSLYRDTILMLMVGNICVGLMYLMQMVSMQFGMYIPQIIFWANSGIAWALIKSESRYDTPIYTMNNNYRK